MTETTENKTNGEDSLEDNPLIAIVGAMQRLKERVEAQGKQIDALTTQNSVLEQAWSKMFKGGTVGFQAKLEEIDLALTQTSNNEEQTTEPEQDSTKVEDTETDPE